MNEQCFYRVSVKGIVIDEEGRILLSREDNDEWEILGGGLEHGEDPIAGLKREVMEEAGLEVTFVSPNPKYFLVAPRSRAEGSFLANVIYEIKLNNMDFVPSDECQELRFFSIAEMEEVNLFPNVQKLLEILKSERS